MLVSTSSSRKVCIRLTNFPIVAVVGIVERLIVQVFGVFIRINLEIFHRHDDRWIVQKIPDARIAPPDWKTMRNACSFMLSSALE